MRPALPTALVCLACFALTGCGATTPPSCSYSIALQVNPTAATADHRAAPPGNQQQFTATGITTLSTGSSPRCGLPGAIALLHPQWTTSVPLDVTISSAQDSTNGLAACLAATSSPVTLTATTNASSPAPNQTATVTLACK